jgi:hypothetical protein
MKNAFNSLVSGFNQLQKPALSNKPSPTSGAADLSLLTKSLAGLPVHVVDGVKNMVSDVTDYLKVAEQEKTKRTDITAKRDVALASIRAQREAISEMIQFTFQERASTLQKQFDVLDLAMAQGNAAIVDSSLRSMVQVIQSSPFKSIQEMQQSLANKDFVIRLE